MSQKEKTTKDTSYIKGIVGSIFTWVFTIASAIMGVLSLVGRTWTLPWAIIITIICINSLVMILVSIYETVLLIRYKKIKQQCSDTILQRDRESEEKIKEKDLALEKIKDFSEMRYGFMSRLTSRWINDNEKFISIHDDINSQFIQLNKKEKSFINYVEKLKDNYKKILLKEMHDFLTYLTEELKIIIDGVFEQRNLKIKNAVTIKLLNNSYINDGAQIISDIQVITLFRDSETYHKHMREVGKKQYSITLNSDFTQCMLGNSGGFVKNNIKSTDDYKNENINFFKFYNCTAVVPIYCGNGDNKRYFGFLACDTLNHSDDDIYNDDTVKILKYGASILGSYMRDLDYRYCYQMSQFNNDQLYMDLFIELLYNIIEEKGAREEYHEK